MKNKMMLALLVFGLIFVVTPGSVFAYSVTISKTGLVTVYRGVVLGDEDNRSEEKKEEEKKQESKQEEKKEETLKKEMEIKRENLKVEMSSGEEPKIEVKQERVENRKKVEELQRKREVLLNDLERKTEEGTLTEAQRESMKQKIEMEKEREEELRERTIEEISDDGVEVEIEDGERVESVEGELEIEHEGDRVRTMLPVVVDVNTRRVRIRIETGEEVEVERVGDVADELREMGLIDGLSESQTGTPESELRRNDKGELIYDLAGTKNERLFGLLPVEVERQIEVSAQSGEVVQIDQTFVSRLLDLFSF